MKNKFIVFEGIDGSGKSTQCSLFYKYLVSENIPAKQLAEPTSGEYGQKIRKMLQGDIELSVEEQIKLFIEDRQQDFDLNIKPSMDDGITIVMDRYFYSNAAYQGSSIISPSEIIRQNTDRGFPLPDRVYYIDIDPAEAMRRITARNRSGRTELFEKKAFLEVVRNNFSAMTDDYFLRINGNLKQEEIFQQIKKDYLLLIK